MWILAEEVNTGRRIAFPQFSSAVSYDLNSFIEEREQQLVRAQKNKEASLMLMQAQIQLHTSNVQETSEEERERNEQIRDQVLDMGSKLDDDIDRFTREIELMKANLEALILFQGELFPVKAIRTTTSWDDVSAYTGRTATISTDPDTLPPLDEKSP